MTKKKKLQITNLTSKQEIYIQKLLEYNEMIQQEVENKNNYNDVQIDCNIKILDKNIKI